jgi:hypothetical protein
MTRIFRALVCSALCVCILAPAFAATSNIVVGPNKREASSDAPRSSRSRKSSPKRVKKSKVRPTVKVGAVVRALGEEGLEGLVLMGGLEHLRIEPISFGKKPKAESVAKKLAEAINCTVQATDDYYFIYPEAYGALADLTIPNLDPSYDEITAEMAFGAELKLFMAFAWLSEITGKTIVADQLVAGAQCGELTLGEVPLRVGLEAILKSARVGRVKVESTEEYIFFSQALAENTTKSVLINPRAITPKQQTVLDKRVKLILPSPPAEPGAPLPAYDGARSLRSLMRTLKQQLGVRIAIDKAMADLPVNPAVFNNVRVSTALDLLVRQWALPIFGYEFEGERIVIRRTTAPKKADVDKAKAAQKAAEENAKAKAAGLEQASADRVTAQEGAARKKTAAEKAAAEKRAAEAAAAAAQNAADQAAQEKAVATAASTEKNADADKAAVAKAAADKVLAEKAAALAAATSGRVAAEKASAAAKAEADKAAAALATANTNLTAKVSAHKAAAEAATPDQAATEKTAAEQAVAAAKAAADKANAAHAVAQKVLADKTAAEKKAATEKAAAEKAAADANAAADKAAAAKAAADKAAAAKAAVADKAAADKAAAEKKAAAVKQAADKAAADKAAAEKAAAAKAAAEKQAALEKEQAEQDAAQKAAVVELVRSNGKPKS